MTSAGVDRRRRRGGAAARTIAATIAAALTGSSLLIWQATRATYSGTTTNPSNSWATGTVSLTDDDSASAMFSVTLATPTATGQHCIKVTYGGNVTAPVKLYVANFSDTNSVASYLDLTVEEGSGSTFASCAGFSASATIFNGTLAGFSADTDYASGVGTWTPTGAAQTEVYRFTWTLNASAPNSTQASTAAADFVWEAQA